MMAETMGMLRQMGQSSCPLRKRTSGVRRLNEIGDVHGSDAFNRLRIRRTPVVNVGVSLSSNLLDLEITESVLNESGDLIRTETQKLHDAGYHVWIDDFGSGYSSLNVLTEFTFDVLKLDLVFLRSYDHNPKTGELLTYIIRGAIGMGIQPLTEGVETKEHYEFLKKIGCERAQGYYFGKPQPMDETRAMTREKGLIWEKIGQ